MFSVLSSIFSFPLSLAPLNPVILDPKSCLCRLPLDFFPTQHVTPMGFFCGWGFRYPRINSGAIYISSLRDFLKKGHKKFSNQRI